MKKTLLVLGIGPAQVDLIKAGKEMGLRVIACAYDKNGPGKDLVDDFKQIDIKDIEAVKNYAVLQEVDFIYSMGLELSVSTIAIVSEDLGLPCFVTTETFTKIKNKAVWREKLGSTRGNVKFQTGKKVEDFRFWSIYPAILKPVDGSGQRGVYKVDSFESVQKYFDQSIKFSNSKQLIIEKYVDGPEISVNTFIENGELKFFIVSDRFSYDEFPGGIIKEHYIPSKIINKDIEKIIYQMVSKVIELLKFTTRHIYLH